MRITFITACLLLGALTGNGQAKGDIAVRSITVAQQRLAVSCQKTTNLIFDAAIQSVDRGSQDIMIQKIEGVENVLKVKAAKQRFETTNLSVITSDGNIYAFDVSFNANPPDLTIFVKPAIVGLQKTPTAGARALFTASGTNESTLRKLAAQASISKRNIRHIADHSFETEARLTGLYTAGDNFYYKLLISNNSNIDYSIGSIGFFIRDKRKVKRMATQEVALDPVLTIGNPGIVSAGKTAMVILILPKHAIAADKHLAIEIEEDKGGRNLTCLLKNNVLLRAQPIKISDAIKDLPNFARIR